MTSLQLAVLSLITISIPLAAAEKAASSETMSSEELLAYISTDRRTSFDAIKARAIEEGASFCSVSHSKPGSQRINAVMLPPTPEEAITLVKKTEIHKITVQAQAATVVYGILTTFVIQALLSQELSLAAYSETQKARVRATFGKGDISAKELFRWISKARPTLGDDLHSICAMRVPFTQNSNDIHEIIELWLTSNIKTRTFSERTLKEALATWHAKTSPAAASGAAPRKSKKGGKKK